MSASNGMSNSNSFDEQGEARALPFLFAHAVAMGVLRRLHEAYQLRSIEQATYDREFWELVSGQ